MTGHGADEQCGGYIRHRFALCHHLCIVLNQRNRRAGQRGGLQAIQDELELDQRRVRVRHIAIHRLISFAQLWTRNLGRDDRMISQWARELRTPLLARSVVDAIGALPITSICNFDCGL